MSAENLIALAKAFAENRKEFHENSRAIRECSEDGYVDLQPIRDRFYEGKWLEEQAVMRWQGWLHAVQTIFDYDNEVLDEDDTRYCMAILLDERKAIRQRANALKSRLRVIGEKLLNTPQ